MTLRIIQTLRNAVLVPICLLLIFTGSAYATGEQFYFSGMAAPTGSMSSPGHSSTAIYLRWDQMEGQIPVDLAGFRLMRDGTQLYPATPPNSEVPAAGAMSTSEIIALYAGSEQDRRRLEIIRWLAEWGDNQDPAVTVNNSNFATHLRNLLLTDNYWSHFASRSDFNVARARYRGYLDTTASGVHNYELLAISTNGTAVRVGSMDINTNVIKKLAAAHGLKQVALGRCDAPETSKDHGSVALSWALPGTSAGDLYVGGLLNSGYDIYRSISNVTMVDPTLELRTLAGTVMHDSSGSVLLPDLEKLNDQPIVVSSQDPDEEETRNEGWNPPFYQFLETAKELTAQGLKPGDKRAYYIAPRDFTGNYGETERILVTVPDTVAPPPPWAVRTVRDPYGDTFSLEWDHVNVLGFHLRHQQGRTYCNLNSARFDRELRWVPEGQNCDDSPQISIDLDVAKYLVYRFNKSADSGDFTDSDGDGWADIVERTILSSAPPLSSPGTACDETLGPASVPLGTQNHLVATVAASTATSRPSGRQILRFQDPIPASNKGRVFWYRIASVDQEDNISTLSAPTRGFFPNRNRPQRCSEQDFVLGEQECVYEVKDYPRSSYYATDTTGDSTYVVTNCSYHGETSLELASPIVELPSGERGVAFDDDLCPILEENCVEREVSLTFFSQLGEMLGQRDLGYMYSECESLPRSQLIKDCTEPRIRIIRGGDSVTGNIEIDCPAAVDQCLNIYRDIGGKTYHYKTLCPPFPQPVILDVNDLATLGGDQICLSLALQNQSNEVSSKYRLPCFRLTAYVTAIGSPQPVEIGFLPAGGATAQLTWIPPEQPVAGSIVEWYLTGGDNDTTFSDFFPHSGSSAKDGNISVEVSITPEPTTTGWEEDWCFRARSVGYNEKLSDWSGVRCGIRKPVTDPLPEYIPWPKIMTPAEMGGILNRYLQMDGMPVVLLTAPIDLIGCEGNLPQECTQTPKDPCLMRGESHPIGIYCDNICEKFKESLGGKLNFVAYRQSTEKITEPSSYTDYVQVSPLIDRLYCVSFYRSGFPDGVMQDPFIKLVNFNMGDPDWDGYRLVFADRYPNIRERWYRYQLVYFDANGEISGHRQTDWFQAQ